MAHHDGWVPRQHGAWAMLLVPIVIGLAKRLQRPDAGLFLVPLVLAMVLGYLAWNAAALLIKAAPRRRHRLARPVVVYATATALCGLLALGMRSWAIAGWLFLYLPLAALALLLIGMGRERALVTGLLTTAASSSFLLVCAYPRSGRFLDEWSTPYAQEVRWLTLVVMAYFAGTVFVVKSMIRERGNDRFWAASVAFHAAVLAGTGAGVALGRLSPLWLGFFTITLARAVMEPVLQRRGHRLTPLQVGLVEAMLSVLLVGLAFLVDLHP